MASVQEIEVSTHSVHSSGSVCNKPACDSLKEYETQYFGFNQPSKQMDLTLVVEGKNIFVSRAVLELMSPVFQDLLDSNEGNETLELLGKNYGDFVEFLACFYPRKSNKITEENVFRMLPLADEYDIYHVKNQCELCMQAMLETSTTTTEMLVYCIQAVYKYKYELLKPRAVKTLEHLALDDIEKFNGIDNLPNDIKVELYDKWMHTFRYLKAGLSKQRASRMAEWDDVVRYFTIHMYIKTDTTIEQTSKTTDVLGFCWLLNISTRENRGSIAAISASLKCCPDANARFVSCEGEVTLVIANNLQWNEHWKKEIPFHFTPSNLSSRPIELETASLLKRDAGFLLNKQLFITAHVLLRKPVFQEK